MNVHRGSESDRLLRQEASCLMDETSAAAQEKETNNLTSSGLQNLTYPLGPRNDGCLDQEESTTSHGPTRRESMRLLKESVQPSFERCWIITKLVSSIVLMASLSQTLEIRVIISALTLTSTLSVVKI
uniref:Potassium channel tetramerization domain containing 20 n=1 Tax=Molossus molossus TaxID=27622 RepID=A0A7J8GQC0_MOLMO|nr:potassium channel tetramerization domain containing 20 [Molossus molossus]